MQGLLPHYERELAFLRRYGREFAEKYPKIAGRLLVSADGSQARLVAVLDNLGKGASGAAVQSLNLMAGVEETAGLRL